MRAAPGLLFAIVAACGGGGGEPDARIDADDRPDAEPCGVVGDLSLPPALQIIRRTDMGGVSVADGETVPLVDPPQGGKIVLIGMRVKNVDLCDATIQIAIKDLADGHVAGVERRSVTWAFAPDGFAEPAQPTYFYDYANVPLCPNGNIAQSIDGNPWQLEARFFHGDLIVAEQLLTITPTCAESSDVAQCTCLCATDGGSMCGFGGGLTY